MNSDTPLKRNKKNIDINEEIKKHIREIMDGDAIKNRVMSNDNSARHQLFVDVETLKAFIAKRVRIELNKLTPAQR